MSALVMQAVQLALVTKLTGDAPLMDKVTGVHDAVPQGSSLPYVVIDQLVQEQAGAVGEALWRVGVVLEVWAGAQGRKATLDILARLQAIVHHAPMAMEGYEVREMRVEEVSCMLVERATRMLGSMSVEMVVAKS